MTNVLEGITDKTSRADLLARLRETAQVVATYEDARIARMQRIEEQVRAKANPVDLRKVIVSATKEEWAEATDFLDNFEGFLPSTLARLLEGAREVGRK